MPCRVDGNGPQPQIVGPIPDGPRELIERVKIYERATVKAALTGDRDEADRRARAESARPAISLSDWSPQCCDEPGLMTQASTSTGRMGLLQATATNIISMVGVGPFLTIPFMVAAMNGPHVIYAWIAGLVLALADGLVYAQLGAALPGSGGGYLYLREAFKPFGLGGLMAFLFIFQTILIAPLSVAGGAVGFADYLQFVWTHAAADASPDRRRGVRGVHGAALAQHRGDRPPRRGDAGGGADHGRLGDRRRPVHVLSGAGVRLPAGGLHDSASAACG